MDSTAARVDPARNYKIQIVVPIYNEGAGILKLTDEIRAANVDFDSLTFVYDFDGDTSLPYIAQVQSQDPRFRGDKNCYGRGVINALKWGFAHAQQGPLITVMGDCSDDLTAIPQMVKLWEQGATVVCPSRYMQGGQQQGGGIVKSTLSRVACTSLRLLGFPTTDATNNFKLYDGAWLSKQKIESQGGFEVGIELCYRAYAQGKSIKEIPTSWRDRTAGASRFKILAWMPHYLKWYFKILGAMGLRVLNK